MLVEFIIDKIPQIDGLSDITKKFLSIEALVPKKADKLPPKD